MRTTLNLDDALVRELKLHAAQTGRTMTELVEEALRAALAQRQSRPGGFELELVTFEGRLRPGVDVADRDSLYDRMEGRR